MKIPSLLLPLLPIFALLSSSLTAAADGIQTQSSASGDLEVDVTKAVVRDGILTIQITIRNKGADEAKILYDVRGNYYLDQKEKKKYHVLADSAGNSLAYPIYDAWNISSAAGGYPVKIPTGGKTIMWFKFPAPPAATTKIDLFIHDILPFEDLPISQ